MEVVAASPGNGSPFHNHDVREWSRLDSLTGVLERARLETDHWTANTVNSSHKYNKVVDSRARSGVDGNIQQQARRKLEVFQSQVPGGRLQVIKTQTVSSSRWTGRSPTVGIEDNFEDLKLSLNPLDLSSEKSKASVGRSVGRRPPSRSRIRDGNLHVAATTNLHRVSRLCHQVHNDAVKQAFGGYRISEQRQSGDGVEISEIDEGAHRSLSRTKSTSSEDIHDVKKSLEDLEDLEQLQNWRRTSKLRRSLQYPKQRADNKKPPDLPGNTGSVRKIKEDLETGRRLSTALRGNNLDLDALDQILKSISNSSVSSSFSEKFEEPEKDASITKKQKRDSFVTVESIQAVRDRLRRTSSPSLDLYKKPGEEIDDGIVTETNQRNENMNETRVKSYIYGMEKGKNISGTGSLESRSKPGNQSTVKNEDWFSRRKSYGFEQMHSQQETISSRNKRVESSTDSGICRSSEIVVVPTPTKTQPDCASESEDERGLSTVKKYAMIFEKNSAWNKKNGDAEATTITIPITSNHEWNDKEVKRNNTWSEQRRNPAWDDNRTLESSRKYEYPEDNYVKNIKNSLNSNTVHLRKDGFEESWRESNKIRNFDNDNDYKNKVIRRNLESKHLNEEENSEIKRHSIAVDESKYMNQKQNSQFKRISLSITDHDNMNRFQAKSSGDHDNSNRFQTKLNSSDESRFQTKLNPDETRFQGKFISDENSSRFQAKFNSDDNSSRFQAKFPPDERFANKSLPDHERFQVENNENPSEYNNNNNTKYAYQVNKFSGDARNFKQASNDYFSRRCASDFNSKYRSESFYRSDNENKYLNRKLGNGIEEDELNSIDENSALNNFDYRNPENAVGKFKCDEEDESNHRKQNKKVEFCKTEVHFAADSGRVNIVETDEKPPPTQNFRRRRRNSNLIEDFNRNGLPVLHFGDSSYEKMLFSDAEVESLNLNEADTNEVVSCVTVNANASYPQDYEETLKENQENEIPKGILKNKPVKPKPYILGDNALEEQENTWGVKLRTKEETPVWRSTVTVRNTFFENQNENGEVAHDHSEPEFQKLLKQLRPTTKKSEDDSKRNSDTDVGSIRIVSPTIDTRRSSWSVADRIKQVEDLKWSESKGYSTKVNFGEGEATVVENRHPTWPRKEEYSKVDEDDFKYPKPDGGGGGGEGLAFKSPSLIMSTFKTEARPRMPQQLEALRKLYEEVHSDSEADKEVHQILMSKQHDDSSSVVSGSWSKMRAFKHISHYQKVKNGSHALLEKETNNKFQYIDAQIESDLKHLKIDEENLRETKKQFSPVILKKSNSVNVKSAFNHELSSPYLLRAKNSPYNSDTEKRTKIVEGEVTRKEISSEVVGNDKKDVAKRQVRKVEEVTKKALVNGRVLEESKTQHQSRRIDQAAAKEAINRNKSPIKEKVVRQPKKSEMAYFGVKVSPKTTKKDGVYSEKPDLVQCSSVKKPKETSPIYENVKPAFDSSILEELTKAADQILQAVNGYTDEEHHSKYTSEEDMQKREPLDTISETKSWKQKTSTQTRTTAKTSTKSKLKQTSSNSSIDSISRECRRLSNGSVELKKSFMTKSAEQKQRKKVVNGENAKARRLQRASSREALLQSHGSSSEDLAANVVEVVRKPRLVKKTKTTQLNYSNGIELKKPVKKREETKSKHEERVPVISLPEIRHKTAVSTIRSTAEKAASRDKSKLKSDDNKKKTTTRREITKGAPSSTLKPERSKGTVTRDYSHRHTSVTTQKKSTRTTEVGKH